MGEVLFALQYLILLNDTCKMPNRTCLTADRLPNDEEPACRQTGATQQKRKVAMQLGK